MIEIPIDGRGDAFARAMQRVPVELALRAENESIA